MSGTREWDAGTYDRVSAPQLRWGRAVLERLELNGDESVLDAGCGSGRVTELLLERLPAGRLIAVDGSLAMVEQARERLPSRVELVHSDLLELELDEPVDVVFSSATFHWIADHDRLFERIAGWLRPGGRLEAQCGGEGNVEAFLATVAAVAGRSPFADHLAGRGTPHYFAGVAETERRLAAAGLVDARCWLQRISERPPEPRAFLESVCIGAQLAALPPELRTPFAEAVHEAWGPRHELDYVRLNISARRGAAIG